MARPDGVTLVSFLGVVLLGGGNSVAIAYSNAELGPFWGAALRFLAATGVFLAIALVTRAAFPRGRALVGVAIYGFLAFFLSYALAYWGILHIAPGLAQVLLGLTPLATLLIAAAVGQERLGWVPIIGALVSLAGIFVIFRGQLGGALPPMGVAAILGAMACLALSSVALKRFPRAGIVTTNVVAMGIGAALLLALAVVAREPIVLPRMRETQVALIYVVVVGSVAVFWLFVFVLQRWTASAVAYLYVLLPLVTLPLSARLTGERITWDLLAGGVLVLLGVALGALWRPARSGEPVGADDADDRPAH